MEKRKTPSVSLTLDSSRKEGATHPLGSLSEGAVSRKAD